MSTQTAEAFGQRMATLTVALRIESNETIKQAGPAGTIVASASAHMVGAEFAAPRAHAP